MIRARKFRLYPTDAQASTLTAWESTLKFLWNLALEQRFLYSRERSDTGERGTKFGISKPSSMKICTAGKSEPHYVSVYDQQSNLTELRSADERVAAVPCRPEQILLQRLDKAWQSWWERRRSGARIDDGKPSFKGRRHTVGIEFVADDCRISDGEVRIPKLGTLKCVTDCEIGSDLKRVSITRDVDQWYVAVSYDAQPLPMPSEDGRPVVGIDRGVALFLADSEGRAVKADPRLAVLFDRLQTIRSAIGDKRYTRERIEATRTGRPAPVMKKRMRFLPKSKKLEKLELKHARLERELRRVRSESICLQALYYARTYRLIVIEKLATQNMTRSAAGTAEEPGANVAAKSGLNRAILNMGWADFASHLKMKAEEYGSTVLEVPPAYTSQTCSECGVVDRESRVSQSEFICTGCGYTCNADVNAARNILLRGLAGIVAKKKPAKKLRTVRKAVAA